MTATRAYLLLDGVQIDNLMMQIYQLDESPECHALYQGTRYQALSDVGPVLTRLVPGSRLEQHFVEHWQTTAGIWLDSDASEPELVEHLRSLVHADLSSGVTVLLRYYDPRILRHWLPELPSDQRDQVVGPILRIRLPALHSGGSAREILRVHRVSAVRYGDAPWLRLDDEQIAMLNRAQLEEFDQRLLAHMDKHFPDCLAGRDMTARLAWATACREGAQAYGYSAADEVVQWANLCAVLGADFPEAPEHGAYQQILIKQQLSSEQRLERLALELQGQLLRGKDAII